MLTHVAEIGPIPDVQFDYRGPMLHKYFDELKNTDHLPSSLFSPQSVVEQSKLFASHPALRELGAYVLDDENTSSHHCLITAEPLAGSVFFLSHDGDSRVVFDTNLRLPKRRA